MGKLGQSCFDMQFARQIHSSIDRSMYVDIAERRDIHSFRTWSLIPTLLSVGGAMALSCGNLLYKTPLVCRWTSCSTSAINFCNGYCGVWRKRARSNVKRAACWLPDYCVWRKHMHVTWVSFIFRLEIQCLEVVDYTIVGCLCVYHKSKYKRNSRLFLCDSCKLRSRCKVAWAHSNNA